MALNSAAAAWFEATSDLPGEDEFVLFGQLHIKTTSGLWVIASLNASYYLYTDAGDLYLQFVNCGPVPEEPGQLALYRVGSITQLWWIPRGSLTPVLLGQDDFGDVIGDVTSMTMLGDGVFGPADSVSVWHWYLYSGSSLPSPADVAKQAWHYHPITETGLLQFWPLDTLATWAGMVGTTGTPAFEAPSFIVLSDSNGEGGPYEPGSDYGWAKSMGLIVALEDLGYVLVDLAIPGYGMEDHVSEIATSLRPALEASALGTGLLTFGSTNDAWDWGADPSHVVDDHITLGEEGASHHAWTIAAGPIDKPPSWPGPSNWSELVRDQLVAAKSTFNAVWDVGPDGTHYTIDPFDDAHIGDWEAFATVGQTWLAAFIAGEEPAPPASAFAFRAAVTAAVVGSVIRAASFGIAAAVAASVVGGGVRSGSAALVAAVSCTHVGAAGRAAACALTVACSVLAGGAATGAAESSIVCSGSSNLVGASLADGEVSLSAECSADFEGQADTSGSDFALAGGVSCGIGGASSAVSVAALETTAVCSPVGGALSGASCSLVAPCQVAGEGSSASGASCSLSAPVSVSPAAAAVAAGGVSLTAPCSASFGGAALAEALSSLSASCLTGFAVATQQPGSEFAFSAACSASLVASADSLASASLACSAGLSGAGRAITTAACALEARATLTASGTGVRPASATLAAAASCSPLSAALAGGACSISVPCTTALVGLTGGTGVGAVHCSASVTSSLSARADSLTSADLEATASLGAVGTGIRQTSTALSATCVTSLGALELRQGSIALGAGAYLSAFGQSVAECSFELAARCSAAIVSSDLVPLLPPIVERWIDPEALSAEWSDPEPLSATWSI